MSDLLKTSSSNFRLLLTETVFNVSELFTSSSLFIHKKRIESDAYQNAIFHNNCLLFSYLIECMVHTHKPSLDLLLELVPNVKNLASQVFLNQMKYQEKYLLSFIKNDTFTNSLQEIANEIPSTDLKISSQSHFEFRQCINNCLKHLNFLDSAFYNTLPDKIFDRVFSTLITIFLTEFISFLLTLEDISSLASSHLSHEIDYFSNELKTFNTKSSVVKAQIKLDKINFIFQVFIFKLILVISRK